MVQISPWKIFLILLVCAYGVFYSIPNVMTAASVQKMKETLPAWMPGDTINLGLDLRGGAHLLYEVNMAQVFIERSEMLQDEFKGEFRKQKIPFRPFQTLKEGVRITIENAADLAAARKIIRKSDTRLSIEDVDENTLDVTMNDAYLNEIRDQTISTAIEVIRRRIDELGTTEPIIQRQGEDRIIIQVPGLDSKEVRDIVGKTAKLTFHLTGEGPKRGPGERELPYAEGEERQGYEIIKRRPIITGEMLDNAQPTFNQMTGEAVVSFKLNSLGAKKFCDVSTKYVNQRFAIVLDEEVISAPVIREPICGGQGQISGSFTVKTAGDLALLLRAGALPAEMEVAEERTVGPSLGADSVEAGKKASLIALVLVLIFMVLAYGLFGVMADIALLVNVALLVALLSTLQATLTLPGIAGIVLTVGMAVDANVLIFERIREELHAGRSPISSVDAGYSRAMATIIDSNLTTLIAAFILFSFGTGPIKGFAVTLGLGIMTSFFSAIMVTRLMVVLWLRKKRPDILPI
ncbi:MAG: protein translocase subunit SecD [Alphaproteobacteria bacterium]|nr:protein translocase subunit SecD [Alphaproteobacteria bacterium]